MTADIRTAAQREAEKRWGRPDDGVSHVNLPQRVLPELREEFVRGAVWGAARVTPTREQIAGTLSKHQHDYCAECHESYGCTCGWQHKGEHALSTDDYDGDDPAGSISEHQAEVLLALMQDLAEGEVQ